LALGISLELGVWDLVFLPIGLWQDDHSIIALRLSNDDIGLQSGLTPGGDVTGQVNPG
jgi:hypothetical protein